MLHLILGRAGSGKTEYIRGLVSRMSATQSKEILLLVPEQYSFESERAILRLAGVRDAQRIRVYSFSRLAHDLLSANGAMGANRLDDSGRRILMSLALDSCADQLQLFRRHARSQQLCSLLLEADTELKTCAISPPRLHDGALGLADGSLRKKVEEISLVCGAYEALVAQSYADPLDDLERLAALARQQRLFEGKIIALDSFSGFSQLEMNVLEIMIVQARETYITLCCDTLDVTGGRPDIFELVRRTGSQLLQLAKENRVAAAPIVHLNTPYRFTNPQTRLLEENLFAVCGEAFAQQPDRVHLYHVPGIYDEADSVAALIRELVLQQGYHYGDFSVICRSAGVYAPALRAAFAKWEIPCFVDAPRSLDTEPLVRFLLCSFGAAKWSTDDIFTMLKTGLAGLKQEELSLLENYVFIWRINGREWLSPFTKNPDGATGREMSAAARQTLQTLNALRLRITDVLGAFAARMENADGRDAAKALYLLLTEFGADTALQALCEALQAQEKFTLAQEQQRMWNIVMEILDQFATVLQGKILPQDKLRELLEAAICARDIAVIPQGMDEVVFGTADRIRQTGSKVVFILGACEGEFPLSLAENGIFTLEERKKMIAGGIAVHDFEESGIIGEKFLAYTAVCGASDGVYIFWPDTVDGNEKAPSELITAVQKLFPLLQAESGLPVEILANCAQSAFSAAASGFSRQDSTAVTLRSLFLSRPEYGTRLQALENAAHAKPFRIEDRAVSAAALRSSSVFSATQIETFHHCRFRYFCRYGLGAKERIPASLDVAQYGSLVHFLLEQILKTDLQAYCSQTPEEKHAALSQMIEAYAQQVFGGLETLSQREQYLFYRMAGAVGVVIDHAVEELLQSKFRPAYFELELQLNTEFPPLHIPAQGGDVAIGGIIDRVDLYTTQEGVTYVRIVDYKTGKKEFRLSEILYGLNLQMLLYLAAVSERSALTPAGILYMPAARPVVPANGRTDEAQIAAQVNKRLKMNGLLIDDAQVIAAMEEDGLGTYIPAALKNGAVDSRSTVPPKALQLILSYVKDKVASMAQKLLEGDIDADPLLIGKNSCELCPYTSVCLRELLGEKEETLPAALGPALHAIEKEYEARKEENS